MLTKRRTRRDFDPFREPTADEVEQERRQQTIDEAIDRRAKELRREQVKCPMAERLTDDQCREQAEADVYGAIRAAERAEAARRIRADFASAYTRNSYLFKPWFAGAAYAGIGELAAILADTGTVNELGAVACAAAGATVTSLVLWRRIKEMAEKYWSRLRTGVFTGCATCAALPVIPWDWQGGILAAAVVSLIASCARYWKDHAPSYPPMGGYQREDQVDVKEAVSHVGSDEPTDIEGEAADIIADWDTYVRATKILPDAALERPVACEHGWIFTVKLVRGKQRFDTLQRAIPDIAYALNVPPESVHADPNPDPRKPLEPQVTITTSEPDTTYRGPVVVREGRSVFIELGPYTDGRGVVRYELLADQLTEDELAKGELPRGSAVGGFILGDKGSGKTRLMESIALGAMEAGVEFWYLDPQGGASSPTLRDNASWPLMGLGSPDGKRAFGNVEDLLEALRGVVDVRQDENSDLGCAGFQHTPERPMILVGIDECHLVFGDYGREFGDIDRIARKLGIAFLGASQSGTQDVFGGDITLRNGMAGGNGYLLKFNGSNARLAFGALDDVAARGCQQLRPNRTLGYALNSDRPHVVFQNRYTPDLAPFFGRVQRATLDEMARIGAGEAYAKRHETAQQNVDAVRARLAAYRNGTLKPGQKQKTTSGRASAGGASDGNVSFLFPGTQRNQEVSQEVTRESLTERQIQILDMLTGARLTAKDLATELGKTARTISTDLRFLRENKFIRVVDENEGIYTASDNV